MTIDFVNNPAQTLVVLAMLNFTLMICATLIGVRLNLRETAILARRIVRANIEDLSRPFTVVVSRDLPGLADARRADGWLRTSPTQEALFFNPQTQRWQSQNFAYGVGRAFVDGILVTFRALDTTVDEALLAEIQAACESGTMPPELLSRLAEMDHDDVFSVVEACGLVREFNHLLEGQAPESGGAGPSIFSVLSARRRIIDLG